MPKERFFCIMEKILLIQTASIGDVILLTSLMEKLHDKFPNAAIDLVVKSPNEQLFANHPYVRDIWVWNKKNGKYRNLFQIICGIREQHYDVVLCVQRFFSAGLMCVLSGAKHRIGFDKNPLAFLFTEAKPHRIEKGIHEIDRNISLLSDIWCERVPKPRLYPSAKDFGKTAYLRTQAKEYYTLSPCSLWETKTMSKESGSNCFPSWQSTSRKPRCSCSAAGRMRRNAGTSYALAETRMRKAFAESCPSWRVRHSCRERR